MRKCDKKRIKRNKQQQKANTLVSKIRSIEYLARECQGLTSENPTHYWYEVLSVLSTGNLKFISAYQVKPGHLFAVEVFKSALNTLMVERVIGLQKE
jgi:hypothetical protein